MSNITSIEKQCQFLEKYCDGILGVSAYHIESGQTISYKEHDKFLMCSTYKLPMAIYLLYQVEQGKINLNELYTVTEYDLRPGAVFTLNQFDCSSGFPISIKNLMQLMMQESCNTSTDIILRLIGGPASVTAYLRKIGIEDMRIDRYILEALAESDGIKNIPKDHRCTLAHYKELEHAVPKDQLAQAKRDFIAQKEDRATPQAMTQLLTKLFNHNLINADYTSLLLNIMRRNKLYPHRLMGLLPPQTPVAHKTGTISGHTNDAGIITLPHNLGHIAITTFIKNAHQEMTVCERVLAEVGRSIYDYFLLN